MVFKTAAAFALFSAVSATSMCAVAFAVVYLSWKLLASLHLNVTTPKPMLIPAAFLLVCVFFGAAFALEFLFARRYLFTNNKRSVPNTLTIALAPSALGVHIVCRIVDWRKRDPS